MISPEFTDTESFVSTLKILADLMPGMNESSRRRAAWQVAKSRLSLADAVKAEGYALDGATASPAVRVDPTKNPNHKPAPPPTQATLDALAASIAKTKAEIAAFKAGAAASAAAVDFPAEADHAGTFPAGYDAKTLAVHKAAMRLLSVVPMKYATAIATVTRGMK